MILVFGSINVDFVAHVEKIAKPGETVLSADYQQSFGGKGANQAVAAARSAKPDTQVWMVGAVGQDEIGDACIENFKQENICTDLISKQKSRTGCAFISVEKSGENAITVASGANRHAHQAVISEDKLLCAKVAVMQMEVPLAENIALTSRLKANNIPTILNFAPANINITKPELQSFLAEISYIIVNEHEAQEILNILSEKDTPASPQEAGIYISQSTGTSVIVTLGSQGVLLCVAHNTPWLCPPVKVDAVDTTGAGDTFVGALATQLSEGADIKSAIRFANSAAALACTGHGAQSAMPMRTMIDSFGH